MLRLSRSKPLRIGRNRSQNSQNARCIPTESRRLRVSSCKSICMMRTDLPNHYGTTDFLPNWVDWAHLGSTGVAYSRWRARRCRRKADLKRQGVLRIETRIHRPQIADGATTLFIQLCVRPMQLSKPPPKIHVEPQASVLRGLMRAAMAALT